eukprot:6476373-Pyramimonas_sp.AAC.1
MCGCDGPCDCDRDRATETATATDCAIVSDRATVIVTVRRGLRLQLTVRLAGLLQTIELMGVIVTIVGVDRYLVTKSATVEADIAAASEKVRAHGHHEG